MRLPVDQVPDWRQLIWQELRRQAAPTTALRLADALGANRKTVVDYLGCLEAGGYVRRSPQDEGAPHFWELVRDTGHHAPRLRKDGTPVEMGRGTEQMWRAMRMLKEFGYPDLVQNATIPIADHTAKSYCALLLATGYLRVLRKAEPTKGRTAIYRLIRNTGPQPPKVQRVKAVFDPNTGEVHMAERRA